MTKKELDLRKNVFDKNQYTRTIDTEFSELGVTTVSEDLDQQPSVEKFFQQYNELFYDIPPNGPINSHEYLVITSGEYINFDQSSLEIEALRAEISQLRTDLLKAEIENAKLQISGSANEEDIQKLNNLQNELQEATSELTSASEGLSQDISDLSPTAELAEDTTSGVGYFD